MGVARPVYLHPAVYPVVMAAAAAIAVFLARARAADLAAAALIAAMVLYPAQQLRWMAGLSSQAQLSEIRWVHGATRPDDRVLDGFSGLAWFRPQAGYFGFLHPGVRAFLTPDQRASVVNLVASCEHRPALVILDANLRALSPDFASVVAASYGPAAVADMWLPLPSAACP
jgi:hypothetical protein